MDGKASRRSAFSGGWRARAVPWLALGMAVACEVDPRSVYVGNDPTAGSVATAGTRTTSGGTAGAAGAAGGRSGGTGGSGGTRPAGGNAGKGGENGATAGTAGGGAECEDLTLTAVSIDDLEDGDGEIAMAPPYRGFWFSYHDGTGELVPEQGTSFEPRSPGSTESNGYAACVRSDRNSEFTEWGAGMGFQLYVLDDTTICKVDGSRVRGIRFQAKGTATGNVVARIATTSTLSTEYGGECTAELCYDNAATLTLSANWEEQELAWSDFDDGAAPFSEDEIVEIKFEVNPTATDPATFDFCIDDVELF